MRIRLNYEGGSLSLNGFRDLKIDLSNGIICDDTETLIEDLGILNNAIHLNCSTAHHDAIIVCNGSRIAISFKRAFSAMQIHHGCYVCAMRFPVILGLR